ncbi:TonB-dependent receptor [Candidatus Koribacter versatilis Ellin345]|uniref:TonB-dependent receptor n=1 Tax=Koribacter versatilis (strain Ellin345) TaxID=204669 RepID=Q1IRT3_KORVE|nr:carboxypeptidase regulatory-like domain-containing protein [Candidatus Koribacter versatilis]ABF40417.1 TonB-dependent receptor [Candidatus Koribacter versatilis Ellin345]
MRLLIVRCLFISALFLASTALLAGDSAPGDPQSSGGNTGAIEGTVADPTGAVIPNATVTIKNPVTGYTAKAATGNDGSYIFRNVPFNNYHVTAEAKGFTAAVADAEVRSGVPFAMNLTLPIAAAATTVDVQGDAGDLVETDPVSHTDVDRGLIDKLPVEGSSSQLSSVITLSTPGITADSNGQFHPLGEHADTSFSLDNQPMTDQQSKVFSNQISTDAIQSMEVISGVAPAEFGDKNSLVVRVATRSGLGLKQPTGSISTTYGSFGTSTTSFNILQGNDKLGNFFSVSGLNSGRFLDTPEFMPLHARGNSQSGFDRADWQAGTADVLHLNLGFTRSWFQIPNSYDQQFAQETPQDQRQEIKSLNVSPGWTHTFNNNTLLATTAWFRQDQVGYYPSDDILADQPATLSQSRRLTNTGIKTDVSYVKGIHNFKAGVQFEHTILGESFGFGLTDPLYNALCVDSSGLPVVAAGVMNPGACAGFSTGYAPNPGFDPNLLPYDLTRSGMLFNFVGHADVKEESIYAQDAITLGKWVLNLGVRGDNYNGISSGHLLQPRLGVAYNVNKTHTVLRASFGRFFETPYNENLVLSSATGAGGLAQGGEAIPIQPGHRTQYDAGLQQAIGKWAVVDAEYFWKFTKNAYDFDTLFNTPLAFPIEWKQAKIDGFSARVTFPTYKGVTAYTVLSHTRARFFPPENGGLIFNSDLSTTPFRIDHDQAFGASTNVQYQPKKDAPWISFTWRYDSGEVAGAIPDFATALTLTGDEQAQMGLFCGDVFAAPGAPIRSCAAGIGATRVVIPAAGTYDADKNPARIASRNVLDMGIGWDNIFHADRYKTAVSFTVANLTNKDGLYNFLSTFSGTHFIPPRSYTGQVSWHF